MIGWGQWTACSSTQLSSFGHDSIKLRNKTGCHDGRQDISRCCTRVESKESIARRQRSMQARDPLWLLKPRAGVTRNPKQEYQWPHKKDSSPPQALKTFLQIFSLIFQLPSYISNQEIARLAQLFSPNTLEKLALQHLGMTEAEIGNLKATHRENIEEFKREILRIFINRGHSRKVQNIRVFL